MKVEIEQESLGAKEIVKTVAEKSTDSSALFSEIYEKHIGSKVSFYVGLILNVNSINDIHK